ncbi:MAG: chemotaxis protein CheW [Bacteroidales bacterium]
MPGLSDIKGEMHIVVFTIDEQQFALPLTNVTRIVNAVEIRYLPMAPEVISGIINFQGQILPVIDIRKKLGLPGKETALDDRLIIAHTDKRPVAIVADTVPELRSISPSQQVWSQEAMQLAQYLQGVVRTDDGLILIYDLDKFLDLDEELALENALKHQKK